MPTALWIARAFESYLLVGIGFGAWFAARGAGRLDPIAAGGSWGFRLLVFPAAVALWPYLAARLIRGGAAPPIEDTDHRRRARAHPPSR